MSHYIHPQTAFLVLVFLGLYELFLLWRLSKIEFDLYDFFMLSLVALVPAFFVVFPKVILTATDLVGVKFPFLLLCGGLFLAIFLIIYSLIRRINASNRKIVTLAQELALRTGPLESVKVDSLPPEGGRTR